MHWEYSIRATRWWVSLILQILILGSNARPIAELQQEAVIPGLATSQLWLIIASAAVVVTAVTAIACCSCETCQTNKANAAPAPISNMHSNEIKNAIEDARKQDKPDVKMFAQRLYEIGVRQHTVFKASSTFGELEKLGVTHEDFVKLGGREELVKHLRELEIKNHMNKPPMSQPGSSMGSRQLPPQPRSMLDRPLPSKPVKAATPAVPVGQGLDAEADFDQYTVYDQGRIDSKYGNAANMEGGAGLDEQADFENYTIYDAGELNQYAVLKAERQKKIEGGAGLDQAGNFDEYTIYDAGHMNEYGIALEARRQAQAMGGGVGMDTKADFDDYTIYSQGQLNEYGVLKAEREKMIERQIMTTERQKKYPAISESPAKSPTAAVAAPSPVAARPVSPAAARPVSPVTATPVSPVAARPVSPVAVRPASPVAERPASPVAGRPVSPVAGRPVSPVAGKPGSATAAKPASVIPTISAPVEQSKFDTNFDDYTIYEPGELNEYGVLKDARQRKIEGGAGLDTMADFDDYTIYDQGPLNAKIREGGAGLDQYADFEDYTIYDQGPLNDYGVLKESRRKEGGAGLDEAADFDDYTIYDPGHLNEYAILKDELKKQRESGTVPMANKGRNKQKVRVRTKIRVKKNKSGESQDDEAMKEEEGKNAN